jgi:hypothetical protein
MICCLTNHTLLVDQWSNQQLDPLTCVRREMIAPSLTSPNQAGPARVCAAALLTEPQQQFNRHFCFVDQLIYLHLDTEIACLSTCQPACCSASNRAAGFAGMDGRSDTEPDSDALGISTGLSLLPHCLADLSRVLGARLEPFAVGPVSTAIAKELYALPQKGPGGTGGDPFAAEDPALVAAGIGAPGGASGSIGLVLIDRSLDLATPCMHSDHVLDVVFASLPRAEPAVTPVLAAAAGGGGPAGHRVSLRYEWCLRNYS